MAAIPIFKLDIERSVTTPAELRGGVVAIGSFDGVHRGHQALIAHAAEAGARLGAPPLALTFEPHPRTVIQPDAPFFRLSSPEGRRAALAASGASGIVEAAFTKGLSSLDPDAFARLVLAERLAARGVVVGEGFRFGRKRAGDTTILRELGAALGFRVEVLPPVTDAAGVAFSSGRVRDALAAGDIAAANDLLGYRWFAGGTVVSGDRRGRELGYPTANVRPPPGFALRHGIYAVTARWDDQTAAGVASFGIRPTFGGGEPLLETHLFDRDVDLYGRELTVVFLAWLRAEERFGSLEALIEQMDADSRAARAINAAAGGGTAIDQALAGGA